MGRMQPTVKECLSQGARQASDELLVSVLLGLPDGASLPGVLKEVLERRGIAGLRELDAGLLRREPGLGTARAARLEAAVELSSRISEETFKENGRVGGAQALARHVLLKYRPFSQEILGAVFIDLAGRVIAEKEIFRGTLTAAYVEPAPILREALLRSARAFLVFHTHPSDDPRPSREDIAFSNRLHQASLALGIRLVDQVVVASSGRWHSIRTGAGDTEGGEP
jgi:DNA repair protein RadC